MKSPKTIKDLKRSDLKDRFVLLRLDLNAPIVEGKIQDDFRLEQSLPTIEYLQKAGAKVLIISHLGKDGKESLEPVADYLRRRVGATFCPDFPPSCANNLQEMRSGNVMVLENLRRNPGEKENNEEFAEQLAGLADIYINDAFSASHRKHASIVGVPKLLPSYLGFLFAEEIKELSKCFEPKHPFVLILGGKKFDTKLPLLKKFIKTADQIFVIGALAHNFFKLHGWKIGKSLFEETPGLKQFVKNKKIYLPTDVVVDGPSGFAIKAPDAIGKEEIVMDAGPETIEEIAKAVAQAKFILWNGPAGNFEKGFSKGTLGIAQAVADSKGYSVAGGGDTLSAIADLKLGRKINFISTAGGAMLDFLGSGTLPGLEAVRKCKKRLRK